MSCPVCGAQNEAQAAFCYRCGSALKPAASVTGPTVNLGRADTPAFGTPILQPEDESGARVYDIPATPSASSTPPAATFAPASADALPVNTPAFSVPQYTVPQPSGAAAAERPTSNSALISMILGICSLGLFMVLLCTLVGMPISAVLGIPAVIVGRNARREIRASAGQMTGDGMAQAGIVMGWISIALSTVAAIAICGFFTFAAISAS